MQFMTLSKRLAVPASLALVLSMSACAPSVEVSSAADSNNPACAPMMVALPDTLADAKRRTTSSQATAAWGDPSLVVLRCGVTPPGPTTDRCVTVNSVDWVAKQDGDTWTLTTFGRNPAAQVVLDPNKILSSTVLAQLSSPASKLPKTGSACVGVNDTENLPTPPATAK